MLDLWSRSNELHVHHYVDETAAAEVIEVNPALLTETPAAEVSESAL